MDHGRDQATVVILTALEVEYAEVRRQLSEVRPHRHEAGTWFEVGNLPGGAGRVAIAITGKGNQPSAVLSERAIREFRPVALLFVGVAGALHDGIDIGDLVVATKVYGYHGGIDEDDGFRATPEAWHASHELEQLARATARSGSWRGPGRPGAPAVHFQPIAAGEVVLNSRNTPLARQLHRGYGDAAAIEMESAGAALAAHLNRALPVLAIRGISDKADGSKYDSDEDGWQPTAAAHAADFAITLAAALTAHSIAPTADHRGEVPRPAEPAVARRGVRQWLLVAAAVGPPLIVGALFLTVWASYASFYDALGLTGPPPVDGATLVLSTGYLCLVWAIAMSAFLGCLLIGAALVPSTDGSRAVIPLTALVMVLAAAGTPGLGVLPIPFMDSVAILLPVMSFGAGMRLPGRKPDWHFFAGFALGLAAAAAAIVAGATVLVIRPGSQWWPGITTLSIAGIAMFGFGRWVAYERRRTGLNVADETTPWTLVSRLNPLPSAIANARERMTGREARWGAVGLIVMAVFIPLSILGLLVYQVGQAAEAGAAAREHGYVPDDQEHPGIWSSPVLPATITIRRPGDDPERMCGASPGWAASIVARDDTGSWVLLRPIGGDPEAARTIRLSANDYTVHPVLDPAVRQGDPWTEPAC